MGAGEGLVLLCVRYSYQEYSMRAPLDMAPWSQHGHH